MLTRIGKIIKFFIFMFLLMFFLLKTGIVSFQINIGVDLTKLEEKVQKALKNPDR